MRPSRNENQHLKDRGITVCLSRNPSHVCCKHGCRKDFFQGRAIADFSRSGHEDFSRGGKSGEISFFPVQTKKATFVCYKFIDKFSFKNPSHSLPTRTAASERQYTAAGGEVRVPIGSIYVWRNEGGTSFILLRLNPLGQRKLPIAISLSRMLCFGRVCASPCALNVSTALHGAYTRTETDW